MDGPGVPSILSAVSGTSGQTHVLQELGFEHWFVDGKSWGRAPSLPGLWVPGTQFVRIGVLAILADLVSGQPESGPVTPTTDLSVHLVRQRAMETITLVATVLKQGATLLFLETLLMADDEAEPFATSLATFMSRPVQREAQPEPIDARLSQPIHSRIGAEVVRPGVVELVPRDDVANLFHGTVQGGVMAVLGELAAESLWAEGEPHMVIDLDIRFLNRVKVGPVRATAHLLAEGPRGTVVDVALHDVGDAMRAVAHVSTTCVPVQSLDLRGLS
jgi:acyl-coenzyme A thioesterase PaaI-like protein